MSEKTMIVDGVSGGYVVSRLDHAVYIDAVNNVSFSTYENEVLGIAGESGCGKSTLIKILYGFIKEPLVVKSGKILINVGDKYADILSMNLEERKRRLWWRYISYIPQNSMNVLNPTERIGDHFAEIFKFHLNLSKKESYKVASEYIQQLGLPKDVITAYPHQLSGGMRQRVVIALALVMKPKIVLADEPTTALDVVVQRGVLQILLENQRKLRNTLVIVTHDMGIHAMLTNRVMIMYAGRVAEIGNTEAVFEQPLHPYTKMLIDSLPRLGDKTTRSGLSGQPPDLSNPPPGCRFHPRCPFATDTCRKEVPPMIDVDGRLVACWLYLKR